MSDTDEAEDRPSATCHFCGMEHEHGTGCPQDFNERYAHA